MVDFLVAIIGIVGIAGSVWAYLFRADPAVDRFLGPSDPEDIACPVCGYYCLGKGGFGCIDKPGMQK